MARSLGGMRSVYDRIADDAFSFDQNPLSIAAEAALDGIYVVRTNLPAAQSDAPRDKPVG